ncbi:achaete-scute homolog 5 [Engraulis encrasicolus]|uniref:achaete-scute homolog 5 n=1 Tax=Engraulis encrasicolus TaxID=184585 RepID=UPI002FD7773D
MALPRELLGWLTYSRTGGLVDPPMHPYGLHFPLEPTYLDSVSVCGQEYNARLPSYVPLHAHISVYDYSFEPAFIRKRNERERQRVRCVNEGYARLRRHLPHELDDKRMSKVETLRAAIGYIKHLQELLSGDARAGSVFSSELDVWSSAGET